MKVVKCNEYVPREFWGKVIENDIFNLSLEDGSLYRLVENETFPLPEVGDKVYISEDGKFSNVEYEYRGTVDDQHVCRDEGDYLYLFPYIKPVIKPNKQTEDRKINIYVNGVKYVPEKR